MGRISKDVTNLTSTNVIGVSKAAISNAASGTIVLKGGLVNDFPASPIPSVGSYVNFTTNRPTMISAVFDSNANKVVVFYQDYGNSSYGTAVVGTVSGNTTSWGTPVVFNSGEATENNAVFDSNANKIINVYKDGGASNYGNAIVGTVSGTSISFGSEATWNAGSTTNIGAAFDSTANKVVIAYRDDSNGDRSTAVVGTVSGTSISFGSEVVFRDHPSPGRSNKHKVVYDSNANKSVICFALESGGYGTCTVVTLSGTTPSFGSEATFKSANVESIAPVYDSNSDKVVIAYSISGKGKGIVGTVSGTSISFGTEAEFSSTGSSVGDAAFDAHLNKIMVVFVEAVTTHDGHYAIGTVSGTGISFASKVNFTDPNNADVLALQVAYDLNVGRMVTNLKNNISSGGNAGWSWVIDSGGTRTITSTSLNLTTDNFLGIADAAIADDASGTMVLRGGTVTIPVSPASASVGTPVVYAAADTDHISATFDSNSNKVVIAYRDGGNSEQSGIVVGTVSGTAITYGTEVQFEAAEVAHIAATFDSNSNKVVIAYQDKGNSNYGTAIVGTVSGTSISFGTAVVYSSANSYRTGATFDSSNNKVVISYTTGSMKAIVGTVSGTSISFGTAVQFDSASTSAATAPTFDSNSNKVVIAWQDAGNSSNGYGIVGTVSGTAISFGTKAVFESGGAYYVAATFDSSNNKVVIAYYDYNNSYYGTAAVGTVSGTAISFGTPVVFEGGGQASYNGITFDSNVNKVVITYKDVGNSNYGTAIEGTVSGTSISFGTAVVFETAATSYTSPVFDSNSNKVVISYEDAGNSSYGTGVVYTPSGSSLTIGSDYYVQIDGTLNTSADDPSVKAGKAISTTTLLLTGDL
jgi:hypothetical protein